MKVSDLRDALSGYDGDTILMFKDIENGWMFEPVSVHIEFHEETNNSTVWVDIEEF